MMDNNFLEKVSQLFLENGAKTLTMDDIAREFGISKKTLYLKYRNKESLLEDVLAYKLDGAITALKEMNSRVDNAVERMLCRNEQLENAAASNKSILIRQLAKYYPEIFSKHMTLFAERFSEVMIRNIQKGREQGYYRQDFDEAMYARFFFHLVMSYDNLHYGEDMTMDRLRYNDEVLDFYMSAITTQKGKETFEKINLR